jgi:hypothetical protein
MNPAQGVVETLNCRLSERGVDLLSGLVEGTVNLHQSDPLA